MSIVTCHLSPIGVRYVCHPDDSNTPPRRGRVYLDHTLPDPIADMVSQLLAACAEADERTDVEVLAIHAAYGGSVIDAPATLVDAALVERLDAVTDEAPLLIPVLRLTLTALLAQHSSRRIVLCCGTGFFSTLPDPEKIYAMADNASRAQTRRYGFHGIFHHNAMLSAHRHQRQDHPRILSFCLDDHPELAAIDARRPVLVTGGDSPLDGLPGVHACGDIDPSIPLVLSQQYGMEVNCINRLLTHDSGLAALLDRPLEAKPLFHHLARHDCLATRVFQHRLLMSAGAGIAAMGGLDIWINSGPYALEAEHLVRPVVQELQRFAPRGLAVHTIIDGLDDMLLAYARSFASSPAGHRSR